MINNVSCALSFAQKEVCLAINQSNSNLNYNLCDVMDIRGTLDIEKLKQAVTIVFQEIETLRTVFNVQPRSGSFEQYIIDSKETREQYLEVHDVSNTEDPDHAYDIFLETLLNHDMDIENGPTVRLILICLDINQYKFIELGSHVCIDGFGHSIMSRTITENYNKLCRNEALTPHNYPPLSTIATAEEAYQNSEMRRKDRDYWRQYCLNMPEPTQLVPGDAPLVKLNRLRKVLHGEFLTGLKNAATAHNLQLSSILIAICATYVHRITGQSELAFGMPVAARQLKALRSIPSMVANILPLHLSFDVNSTVISVAANVQRQLRRHLLHQTYRFEQIIRDLYDERGHKPLFKTMLNVIAYEQNAHFDGAETTVQNVASGPADHFGIEIFDRNKDGRLEIDFNANADLFSPEALEMHYQRLITLLKHFAKTPTTLASDYSLFLSDELQNLHSFPVTSTRPPLFSDTFKTVAQHNATLPALSHEGRQLSYAMLDDYSDRLAHHLLERGTQPGDCVAVLASRSIECIVTMAALFKLGAGYVPIDPDLPVGRIEYILNDANPSQFIIAPGSAFSSDIYADKQLHISHEILEKLPQAMQALSDVDPNAIAYLIYTSGSTGKPKGVEVTHRNLVPIAHSAIDAANIQPGKRVLQFIAAGFDMSVLEMMMTLLSGATLVISDKVSSTPGKPLATLVKQQHIDMLVMTPSLLAYHKTEDFPQNMTLLLGGESCTPALLARFSHCHLLNVYGPTETSFATSINTQFSAENLSIGAPTSNTRLYVVDQHQRLLPPGSWGELFIGGPGVAKGYRNLPELTAEYFVPDLLNKNETMYRVGDRVYVDTHGDIHYLGRKDNQVKIRGLRIELDEIKNTLLNCADVEDAVVLVRELSHGPALIGYVASQNPDSERLKQSLSQYLPMHMVPNIIMVVPEFPLTSNGKLAINQLPAPVQSQNIEKRLPQSEEEEVMCHLFASILSIDNVYANENFFDLGGHSLLGLQLINQINDEFNVKLGINDFLVAPTPAQLVHRLTLSTSYTDPFGNLLPLRTEGKRPPLFCVHPGGGIAWPFSGLLPYLPEEQPVYAIQSPSLRDPKRIIGSLDELAQEYMQLIQSIQPEGPYYIAGWSAGGNIALRIAAMLQEKGEQVNFVCLFDSYPLLEGHASLILDDATIIARMTRSIAGAPRAGIKGLKSAMKEVLGSIDIGEDFLMRIVDDAKLMLELLGQTEYTQYDGDLIFIRATRDILRTEAQQPSLWSPYISGSMITYEVDAPHECLLQRQYLEQFGQQFAEELNQRQITHKALSRDKTIEMVC